MSRFDEAFREFQIARELDPVSLGLIRNTAEHFRYLRQYDRKVLGTDPSFENALESLSYAYANKRMYKESINVTEELATIQGKQELAKSMKTAYARGGYKDALRSRLEFSKDRRKAGSFIAFWDEALLQAQLGNKDLALEALEKGYLAFPEAAFDGVWASLVCYTFARAKSDGLSLVLDLF
jgi:hypothetical protein